MHVICEAGPAPGGGCRTSLKLGLREKCDQDITRPGGRRLLPSRTLTTINVRLHGDPRRADARAPGLRSCWHTQRHTGQWTLEPPQTLRKLHDELRTVFIFCIDGGYYCGTSSAALHLAQRDRRDNELMPTTMYTKWGDASGGRSLPGPTFEQRRNCPNSLTRLLSEYDASRDDRAFASATTSIQDPVKQCSSNFLVGFSVTPT